MMKTYLVTKMADGSTTRAVTAPSMTDAVYDYVKMTGATFEPEARFIVMLPGRQDRYSICMERPQVETFCYRDYGDERDSGNLFKES